MKDLKIIFLGTPEFGTVVLEGLIKADFKPVLVITEPDKPVGRKQILTPAPVKLIAQKYNIPVGYSVSNINMGDLKLDLGIVAAYGQIIPKKILEIPKYGFLNVHPSLLPKYRGPSPIQSAILNGDAETGVTIMLIDEKIDHGHMAASIRYPVDRDETYKTLSQKLAKLGAELLTKTISDWVAGKINPLPQDEAEATYTKLLKREDGLIDWKKPIDYIDRQVRALNPWPGTYMVYKNTLPTGRQEKLKILKTEVADNKLLIKEVQLEGKKPMSFADFQRGHQDFKI